MTSKERWWKRFINYLRDVRNEAKKVTWPSRREVANTTFVVIMAVIFFGFYLFLWDVLFSWILARIEMLLQ
ncbi:MAG: preprotein translocase subunit SecE [Candidatus Aminicenantes bacterium]|nr:preprotein translocase subunit SecE [Candidatus Aminicenantes bacterium]